MKLKSPHRDKIISHPRVNKSTSALARALLCGGMAFLVTGCVSQQSTLQLESTAPQQNIAVQPAHSLAASPDGTLQAPATQAPLANNIPVRAPRGATAPAPNSAIANAATNPTAAPQTQVAAATQATTDTVQAVRPVAQVANAASNELAIAQTVNNTPTAKVIENAAPATPIATPTVAAASTATTTVTQTATQTVTAAQTATPTTAPSPKPVQATPQTPPTPEPVQVASVSSAPAVETPTAPAVETPQAPAATQKPSFFQRLFGTSSKTETTRTARTSRSGRADDTLTPSRDIPRSKRQKQTKTEIRSVSANRNSEPSDLPGVKPTKDLFGIEEEAPKKQPVTRVAAAGSLGRLSPNGLRLQHSKVQVACLKPGVLRILKIVERHYGRKPIITSGYRSPKGNRRAGGARNSQHIFCKAVDIQVEGVSKWKLAKFIRTIPGRGGVGTYCRTKSVHFDIGSVRDWHHPCRKSSKRKRKKKT